jgi:mediator of replication checkpoint protein 1
VIQESLLTFTPSDRERADDEKQVEKLFKDITTGMLRRKRGADYDLSDSDDGGEARRRMKRRQFSKMQKALFSDERVKKIAENPGNQAFLRTIEDRGSDDEMDFLDIVEQPAEDSQSQSQPQENKTEKPQTIPDSQPRKALGASGDNRPAAHLRRTRDGMKPSNIGELRETLSDLLEEPHGSVIPATEVGSDNEDEDHPSPTRSDKENHEPNPRRGRVAVVDRISLKRNSSSASATSTRLAFATAQSTSFKVPALLRRATTNSLVSGSSASTTSSGVSTSASGFGDDAKMKKIASKKSGINAFARDSERRARLEESERRREEKKIKGAERRIGMVGGLLGRGAFE